MNGQINGGWDYVIAAYAIVWVTLLTYGYRVWKQSKEHHRA